MSYFCFGSFVLLSAVYALYLYSYSQRGSIYSGICSCSLGYFVNFCCCLHWFPLDLVILKVDVTVFGI
jgi:hypothetical protein